MKKGFTLVELSIVLVIVGLLIGGILIAQSMIETSKITAFVKQINQIDVAVSNFKTKYKSLPGDSSLLSPGGNNDGYISALSDEDDANWQFAGSGADTEIAKFWVHLNKSGYDPQQIYTSTLTGGVVSGASPTPNVPQAILGTKALIYAVNEALPYSAGIAAGGYENYHRNHYLITAANSGYLGDQLTPAFTPTQALSVDKRMDDGFPRNGDVMGSVQYNSTYYCSTGSNTGDPPNTSETYDLTQTGLQCELAIKMLSQTGGS